MSQSFRISDFHLKVRVFIYFLYSLDDPYGSDLKILAGWWGTWAQVWLVLAAIYNLCCFLNISISSANNKTVFFTTGWRLISVLKLKSVKDLIKIFGCVKDLMTFSKRSQSQLLGTNVSKHWLLVLKLVSAKNLFRIKVGVWLSFSRMEQARFQKWLAVAVPIKSYRCILASQCLCYELFLLYRKTS